MNVTRHAHTSFPWLACSLALAGLAATAACGSGGSGGSGGSTATGTGDTSTGTTTGSPTSTGTTTTSSSTGTGGAGPASPKVIMILMENHNWSDIKGSASAPYITSLLALGAHAEQYFNPPGIHPSEPNYLWLEAGTNFGVADDSLPAVNHQSTTAHLVTQLEAAGHSWKAYQEDISGTDCPLKNTGGYAPKHNPMVFFDDVTDKNTAASMHCIAHERPYTELAADLAAGKLPDYSFLTPILCHDMHDTCAPQNDSIKQGDDWLSQEVPKIMASKPYMDGATVIITWDEGENGVDGPIGLIVLGKHAKVNYSNMTHYTHSSTLRTVQEIFGVSPFLGDAAMATDLADLFTDLPK
jgi:phosphatidylinositol-3-phosphatase